MNILFVDQFGELGGGQQCLLELMPAIAERGWRAFAAVPTDGGLMSRLQDSGVTVEAITLGDYSSGTKTAADSLRFLMMAPALAVRLRSFIRKYSIDEVYANGPRVLPAAVMAAGRLPVVFHAHNYLPTGMGRRLVRTALKVCPNPTVISVSQFVATYLPESIVVPNGVADLRAAVPRNGRPNVGVIGRIAPEKGQADFIEAVRQLPRDWTFRIAGTPMLTTPAYAESVRQKASGLPVEFMGWESDLSLLYGKLDLLVVPSAPGEGFGRVIIEAFSAGVPVIAYDSGGIAELIEDGVSGYLVRPQTPTALAARVRRVMEDREGRRNVARNARARWESHYTLRLYRERVTDIIARAANRANRPATNSSGR